MAISPLQISTIFPIPLVSSTLAEADVLNAELLAEIADRRTVEQGVTRSNLGGWDSLPDLFTREEPAHQQLAAAIDEFFKASCDRLMSGVLEQTEIRREAWISVGSPGAMRGPHDHAGSFWSGSYYVAIPDGADDNDVAGAIEFVDPRGSIGTNALIRTPFTEPRYMINPVPGQLLLWPSYLKHWVHPNRTSEERVMVAFNAWFAKKGS